MADLDFPTIGDILLSPHTKVLDPQGNYKYDLLECDGGTVDSEVYPVLYDIAERGYQSSLTGRSLSLPVNEEDELSGMLMANGYVFATNYSRGYFYRYTTELEYVDLISLGGSVGTQIADIVWDGTNYYTRRGGTIYKLSSSFTFVSYFNVDGGVTSMTYNGENLVISTYTGYVMEYSTDGSLIQIVFSTEDVDSELCGISYGDSCYYLLGATTGLVYKYSNTGEYLGFLDGIPIPSTPSLDYNKCVIYYNDNAIWVYINDTISLEYTTVESKTLPSLTSPSTTIPYKIVADLTE